MNSHQNMITTIWQIHFCEHVGQTLFLIRITSFLLLALGLHLIAPQTAQAALYPPSYDASLDGVQKAFPTAEGFGKYAQGGRGGDVYIVSNLSDSGPGSLRECVEASGARTCVFALSGEIKTQTAIRARNPYLTIAGHTAPGDGIMLTIRDTNSISYPLSIQASHVIIRHISIRPGPSRTRASNLDAIQIGGYGVQHIILDHVSLSWGTDETLTATGNGNFVNYVGESNSGNITVQWSMIYEALRDANHTSGLHSRSTLFRNGIEDITFHHNIIANSTRRNPSFNASGQADFVNNVIFNSSELQGELYTRRGTTHFNWVGNVAIAGPSTPARDNIYMANLFDNSGLGDFDMYVTNNISIHRPSNNGDDRLVIDPNDYDLLTSAGPVGYGEMSLPASEISGPEQAYRDVLAFAGATRPLRDETDERFVADVRQCWGAIIDHPNGVGGWPVLQSTNAPTDSDQDGVPDSWETARGLNPFDAADRNGDDDSDGYTNLEEYLNELAGDNDGPVVGKGTGADPDPTCGYTFSPRRRVSIYRFDVTPSAVRPGEPVTITWDADAHICHRKWTRNADPFALSGSDTITLTESTNIELTCQRSGVNDWKSSYVFVTPDGSVPISLSFTADKTNLTYGEPVTLSWRSGTPGFPDVVECIASGGWEGFKTVAGKETFQVKNTGTYTLTCTGVAGSIMKTVDLNVSGGVTPTPAPTATINADPTSLFAGNSTTLTWTSSNADSCTASGDWSGTKGTDGTESMSPTSDATYAISCTGAGGTAFDSVAVSVTQPTPTPSPGDFEVGARVVLTSPANLRYANLRGNGASQDTGAIGVIVGGPQNGGGGTEFWDVNFDSGADGWVRDTQLDLISTN